MKVKRNYCQRRPAFAVSWYFFQFSAFGWSLFIYRQFDYPRRWYHWAYHYAMHPSAALWRARALLLRPALWAR